MLKALKEKLVLGMVFGLVLAGCGAADFSGSNSSSSGMGKPPKTEDIKGFAVRWEWPCESVSSAARVTDKSIELLGPGPHFIDPKKVNDVPVYFKGEACPAENVARDVVFVIDVSGSMSSGGNRPSGTDPLIGGSCGRMKAIEQVAASIKQSGVAKFGVITFGSTAVNVSSNLYSDMSELYSDLLAGSGFSSIEELICDGNGGTNYDAGLEGAENLLSSFAAASSLHEIYFVSDGEPDPASKNGKVVADRLHQSATIASVMVGGSNDSIMKTYIASKDYLGAPLHARVENSSKLAAVLAQLSKNSIVAAELSYGNLGSEGTSLDFSDKLSSQAFDFEAFRINTSDAPDGLTVRFKYRDKFGNEKQSVGELRWSSAP